MILDLLGSSGSVTGIDVARHRLAACRTMLLKYSLGDLCRLFVADGTTFSLLPIRVFSDSNSGNTHPQMFNVFLDILHLANFFVIIRIMYHNSF